LSSEKTETIEKLGIPKDIIVESGVRFTDETRLYLDALFKLTDNGSFEYILKMLSLPFISDSPNEISGIINNARAEAVELDCSEQVNIKEVMMRSILNDFIVFMRNKKNDSTVYLHDILKNVCIDRTPLSWENIVFSEIFSERDRRSSMASATISKLIASFINENTPLKHAIEYLNKAKKITNNNFLPEEVRTFLPFLGNKGIENLINNSEFYDILMVLIDQSNDILTEKNRFIRDYREVYRNFSLVKKYSDDDIERVVGFNDRKPDGLNKRIAKGVFTFKESFKKDILRNIKSVSNSVEEMVIYNLISGYSNSGMKKDRMMSILSKNLNTLTDAGDDEELNKKLSNYSPNVEIATLNKEALIRAIENMSAKLKKD